MTFPLVSVNILLTAVRLSISHSQRIGKENRICFMGKERVNDPVMKSVRERFEASKLTQA